MRAIRHGRVLFAVLAALSCFATPAFAQYACDASSFSIQLSPLPNPPGTFPDGRPAVVSWYQIAAGQSQSITINYQFCSASFPASATQMRYKLNFGGGITGTQPVVPRTGTDSFAPASMSISVPGNAMLNQNFGGSIIAEALDSGGTVVTLRNFSLDVWVPGPPPTFFPEITPFNVAVTAGDTIGRTFQAAINHEPAFNAMIRVFPGTLPAGVTITPAEQFLNPPYNPVTFTVKAAAGTPATDPNCASQPCGTDVQIMFSPQGQTAKAGTLRIAVVAGGPPPGYTVTVIPDRFNIAQNQTQALSATVRATNGFQGTVTFTTDHNQAQLDILPFSITVPANGTVTQPFNVRATTGSTVGSANFILTGTSGTLQKTVPIFPTITATTQPDFSFSASAANPPMIQAGDATRVTVSATPIGGFNSPVSVTMQLPAGITAALADLSFTLSSGAMTRQITLNSEVSTSGAKTITFTATSGAIQRTSMTTFNVTPRLGGTTPVIDAVSPELTTPTLSQTVFLVGRNFAVGATATSLTPGVVVERTMVRTSGLAEVTVTVRPGVTPRGYRIDVRNPDGASTVDGGRLIIRGRDDLGAALGVSTAAILEPRQGQIIANGQQVYPVGHLFTSGTGTVQGHWALDGVPYDSFSATVAGGRLVTSVGKCPSSEGTSPQICGQMPIPALSWGASHRLELVIDSPAKAVSAAVALIGSPDSATTMAVYEPLDGAEFSDQPPLFRWTLVPGAGGYELEFRSVEQQNGRPRVVAFRTTETRFAMKRKDLLRLGAGSFQWRVRSISPGDVRSDSTPWQTITLKPALMAMRVAQIASASGVTGLGIDPETPADAPATVSAAARDYAVTPNVILSGDKGDQTDTRGVRAQMSLQGELGNAGARTQFTGDLSYAGSPDPQRLVQESRNWVIQAGTPVERSGGDVRFGYTSPDFTDGAEFLTSGLARTGVLARARSRYGTLSYYQPVDSAIQGVISGNPEKLGIHSFGFSTIEGRPYLVRLIGLEVTEPEDTMLGTTGSRLRTFGAYSRYDVKPWLALVGEVASGKVTAIGLGTSSRNGIAFRAGAMGTASGVTFAVNVRSVSANFVNPANRGLNPGGVSDRLATDITLSKSIGRSALSVAVTRQVQGGSDDSTLPDSSQTTATLGLNTTIGIVAMNFGANTTIDRGDGDEAAFLTETSRRQSGFTANFSETLGRLSLGQNLSIQRTDDKINALSSQDVSSLTFNVSGALLRNVSLSSSLTGTRTEAAPVLGTTDNWSVSLQPSIAMPFAALSFQPSISYSRSKNAVQNSDTKGEGYQGVLQWSPTSFGSLVAAQVSTSWNRQGFGGLVPTSSLERSYQASLTMRLNKKRGLAVFPRSTPLAGSATPELPVAAAPPAEAATTSTTSPAAGS
jgi:hypothetical protein